MLLVCLIVVCIALVVSAVASIAFLLRLKRYEHDVYLSLGSPLKPMLGKLVHLHRSAGVLLFLREKSHYTLRDERSSRLGDIAVLANRILLGVIAVVSAISGYIILFVKP